jgi:hypothetical protein
MDSLRGHGAESTALKKHEKLISIERAAGKKRNLG